MRFARRGNLKVAAPLQLEIAALPTTRVSLVARNDISWDFFNNLSERATDFCQKTGNLLQATATVGRSPDDPDQG